MTPLRDGPEAGDRPAPSRTFPRSVLAGPTLEAARALLGARLVRDAVPPTAHGAGVQRRVGRIVEVEAYVGPDDRASHARMGPTDRNRVMFGPPGIAYVYLVYGMHHCLNVVTEPASRPAALLIRAVEPIEGIDAMRAARAARPGRRRTGSDRGRATMRHVADARLAAGPGLVSAAFGLDRSYTGLDLCDPASSLRLERAPAGEAPPVVTQTPRVGVSYAAEPWASIPWRFLVPDSPSVSGRPR